jgi:hypothetical protein
MRQILASISVLLMFAGAPSRAASDPPIHRESFVAAGEYVRDCTASESQRLAPVEAAVARAPKNGRIDRAHFSASWTERGAPEVIRLERGECDGETTITISPMDNADRLDQLDLLVAVVGRMLSGEHGREVAHLFADPNDIVVDSSLKGDVLMMWSSRRTPLFPEGAWLELGPETARIFWVERADPRMRADMLELMAQHRELRGGRPLKWRRRESLSD